MSIYSFLRVAALFPVGQYARARAYFPLVNTARWCGVEPGAALRLPPVMIPRWRLPGASDKRIDL